MKEIGNQFCQWHDHKGIRPKPDVEQRFIEQHNIQVNGARRILVRIPDASKAGLDRANDLFL